MRRGEIGEGKTKAASSGGSCLLGLWITPTTRHSARPQSGQGPRGSGAGTPEAQGRGQRPEMWARWLVLSSQTPPPSVSWKPLARHSTHKETVTQRDQGTSLRSHGQEMGG